MHEIKKEQWLAQQQCLVKNGDHVMQVGWLLDLVVVSGLVLVWSMAKLEIESALGCIAYNNYGLIQEVVHYGRGGGGL